MMLTQRDASSETWSLIKMADIDDGGFPGRRGDSPVDLEARNEREGSRDSDHDDRDRRRRGGGYERDLRRENRRYAPYSQDERSSKRPSGSSGKECRVYVWNLPYNVKWQDLKDFMKTGRFWFISYWIWRRSISVGQTEKFTVACFEIDIIHCKSSISTEMFYGLFVPRLFRPWDRKKTSSIKRNFCCVTKWLFIR